MDYGQSKQNNNEQPFFTAGPGLEKEEANNTSEKDINLSSDSTSWKNEPPRAIGDEVINLNKYRGDIAQANNNPNTPELGEIVNLEFPPDHKASSEKKSDDRMAAGSIDNSSNIVNLADFRNNEKDKISSKTLQGMNYVIGEFEKGKKSPADLDNFVWDAKKAYLKGSYGRDIAA